MRKIHKRIIPLLVSITLLLSICFNVFVGVSANGSNHRAIFTYGDFAGVAVAVGADPDDIIISENKITLPDNEQIMNLYWKNGSKNYRAGSVVSVEELSADNDGNYYFTALFGSVSLDFENINTSNVTLPTSAGNKSKNLYEELSRASSYWRVPQGISNTTADGSGYYALALGNTKMGIVANVGKSGKGLQLSIDKNYSIPEYRNAVLFSHNPTSFDASSNIQYSYVYFTPNTEYMMEFDYKTTSSVDVAVAFGVSTTTGNANCGTKSINSSSFNTTDNHITLESTGGEWQHAFITVTSPSSYTGNSVTSARIGIAVKDNEKTNASTTRKSYLDNIKIQTGGTKVDFVYGNADLGEYTVSFADDEGNITLPEYDSVLPGNDNVANLLWKHGNNLYTPGTNLNISQLDNDLKFVAYFGGYSFDFENINTSNVTLPTSAGNKNMNLFGELSRSASYYRVPQGISNTTASGGYYGLALGNTTMGIANAGKSGKGLQLSIAANYSTPEYRNAVLFSHNPTSFNASSNIQYSYVYFTPNTEYTLEFDYKTTSSVDVAVAFGVSTTSGNANCGTKSINSASFDMTGNHISLDSTNGEWKHGSITVTSPSSYTGNSVTSARVGIAVKDNETTDASTTRKSSFDNINFYPSTMMCNSVKIQYGSETDDNDSRTISYFKFKSPLKSNNTIVLPENGTVTACFRSGVNESGAYWSSNYGKITNLIGWKLLNSDNIYGVQDSVAVDTLPQNAVFSAIYGDETVDFQSVDESFVINNSGKMSYGSKKAKIVEEDGNKFVRLEQETDDVKKEYNHVMMFTGNNKFAGYNVNQMYKITLKYRRLDNTKQESRMYFAFGGITYDWRARENSISKSEVCVTKTGMTDFETISFVVTSPAKHVYMQKNENYYSRTMAVGVQLSKGVVIDIDDVEIKAVGLDGDSFGTASFDFGSSDIVNDTKTMRFAESIILPGSQESVACTRKGVNSNGFAWTAYYGKITGQNAWYCKSNKKYYELGEKVDISEVGKNPEFLAVYEKAFTDFNDLDSNFAFSVSSETSYSTSLAKLKGDSDKYVNITGGEAQKNNLMQVILFSEPEKFFAYNLNKTYKVTFKYRRTDNTDANSSLFVAFGAIPYGWRATSGCVNRITIGNTKSGMSQFETVTTYVTAPDTYEYHTNGNNPEYFYSRTMSIGATISNGVSIDFDDIEVKAIERDEVAMTFSVPDEKIQSVVVGKIGNKLTIPNVNIDRNLVIEGWYTDTGFTKPFKASVFPEESTFVYGKTADAKVRYYGFKDYPWEATPLEEITQARKVNCTIEKGLSTDGDGYALKVDNTFSSANEEQQSIVLPIKVKPETKYLISYDFYYEKIGDRSSSCSEVWFNTATSGHAWKGHKQHITITDEYIPASLKEGKWITGYVYGTTTEFAWSNHLVLMVRVPIGSVRYIDNIVITEIPNEQCIALFKLDSFQSPKPVVARKNTTITMPKANLDNEYAFLNWVLKGEDYKDNTFYLEEDTIFTAKTTARKFTDGFEQTEYGENGLNTFGFDLDWEIYDSKGNNPSNVKSGRYALHRIGKDIRNGAYCFHHNSYLTRYSMAESNIYTVSFWVKVENPVHKLGSIDLASCLSLANPWDFASDLFHVSPISEIADGEWHKLTYTLKSADKYLSIKVPGNLSIYIDDLTVEYTPDATLSEDCSFEEYLPAPLTADGLYIKPSLDDNKLAKFQLVKRTIETSSNEESKLTTLLIIIASSAALVLACGVTIGILLIRKKKRKV